MTARRQIGHGLTRRGSRRGRHLRGSNPCGIPLSTFNWMLRIYIAVTAINLAYAKLRNVSTDKHPDLKKDKIRDCKGEQTKNRNDCNFKQIFLPQWIDRNELAQLNLQLLHFKMQIPFLMNEVKRVNNFVWIKLKKTCQNIM